MTRLLTRFPLLLSSLLLMLGACSEPDASNDMPSPSSMSPDMTLTSPADMGKPGEGDDMAPGMGPNPADDASCVQRCAAKAASCGAPPAAAASACESDYCAAPVNEAYISCLEATSCLAPNSPEEIKRACGKPCLGYPACDGNSVKTCTVSNGVEVVSSMSCGANATCSGGACKQNACVMSGRAGCNVLNSPSNCCDDRQTCFGDGQGGGTCCAKPDSGCDQDSDCCFSDAARPAKCVDKVCVY